jgi:DNA-binding XRE family transcriptional regulator
MDMKDRIRQIMESMHMTQNVFAQFVEMSPASLSSIYTGRTQPTLNTVMAIKKKIPNINTDWLLSGKGEMYASSSDRQADPAEGKKTIGAGLFDESFATSPSSSPMLSFATSSDRPKEPVQEMQHSNSVRNTRQISVPEAVKIADKPQRRVVEIRVFYDDQTWESFSPSKK